MITKLIYCYWQLCLFRESPENTPYSSVLMAIMALLFFFVMLVQWLNAPIEPIPSPFVLAGAALSLILSSFLYTWTLLQSMHLGPRIVQTMTCLWAGHFIIHFFIFLASLLIPDLKTVEGTEGAGSTVLIWLLILLFMLGLTIWRFILTAYIYKQALSINWARALLASIGLLAINILTVSLWRVS